MQQSVQPTHLLSGQVREMALILAPAALLVLGAFWLAYQFVEPAPPRTIVMTTGGESGAYFGFGKKYAEHLAKSGIKLEVRTSAGSVENVRRLQDASSGVHLALLQGGITEAKASPDIVSLGRVFVEPLWVFHKSSESFDRLSQMAGRRIAIGPEGSGTRHLATSLLKANGVASESATFLPLGGQAAADALLAGQVEVVFLALAPEAPAIQSLIRNPAVTLMSFSQAEAYTRLFPYLARVVLPKGVIDLVKNVPAQDIEMVAPQAALVARADLHPALIGLLVDAASELHSGGGLFHRTGEFPKAQDPEFPISEDAQRIYKSGPPFLQRFLPFWLATFVERMFIMIVPIATILIPLFKIVPAIYQWRIRSRILYWYRHLKAIERRLSSERTPAAIAEMKAEIDRIDDAVGHIPVPVYYSEQYYDLRGAVDLVRQRIAQRA